MYKLLIGPALLGAGYVVGSVYGAEAEQLVHKSPAITYVAVAQALDRVRPSGTTFFEGGTPMRYELKIERVWGRQGQARLRLRLDAQPCGVAVTAEAC